MAKHLLKTQNPFMTLPMIFLSFMLLLINVKSDSFSFSFSNFTPEQEFDLGFLGDARPLGGVIQLTRRDEVDGITILREHSVGRVLYVPPVQLWDKSKGKLADFETEFSFVVDTISPIHGDGFSFFIIPFDAKASIPKNSTGGFLGLFNPETAFNSYKNQIVAVEFDSFGNEWDPAPVPIAPHIGIDINSLESVKTAEWPINFVPKGSIGKARISYDSKATELSVLVEYVNTEPIRLVSLTQTIDLRGILPEWVRIGFSGATGDQVETHDIVSWSFSSSI